MSILRTFLPAGVDDVALAFWAAAAASAVLVLCIPVVAELFLSHRRDAVGRVIRVTVVFLFPAITIVPGIMLADGYDMLLGIGVICAMVFFSCFCYYLGRRMGREQGRKTIVDLVGLESSGDIEDAQDRLFESRMRIPNRADVIRSIGEMAKAEEAVKLREERASVGRPLPDVDVVEVEGLFEKKPPGTRTRQ